MLIDILSNNYINYYNIKIARVVGTDAAIYLACFLNLYGQAKMRDELIDNTFYQVDRSRIEELTALTSLQQVDAEQLLKETLLIEVDGSGNLAPMQDDILKLASGDIVKPSATKKRKKRNPDMPTKRECIFNNLKKYIITENEELHQAYEDWIDAVCANPKGFLSKKAVQIFQQTVDNFSNHDLDVALKLVEIATVGGFRDATWAIESYNRQRGQGYRLNPNIKTTETPKLSEAIF